MSAKPDEIRPKPQGAHHHGDLRATLINAGCALIAEGGIGALSVRKVAARAGVSHAAPAHHFKHLADLRAAIAAEGYRRFRRAMLDELERAPADPHARIRAAGLGYVRFARQNPDLFHLMFAGAAHAFVSDELKAAAQASYEVLRQICAPLAPGPAGDLGNEMLVWSVVHGYSSLLIANRDNAEWQENAEALFLGFFPDLPLREDA